MAPPVSLPTLLRAMNEMGRVVDALVADPAVKEKIQAEFAALCVASNPQGLSEPEKPKGSE